MKVQFVHCTALLFHIRTIGIFDVHEVPRIPDEQWFRGMFFRKYEHEYKRVSLDFEHTAPPVREGRGISTDCDLSSRKESTWGHVF